MGIVVNGNTFAHPRTTSQSVPSENARTGSAVNPLASDQSVYLLLAGSGRSHDKDYWSRNSKPLQVHACSRHFTFMLTQHGRWMAVAGHASSTRPTRHQDYEDWNIVTMEVVASAELDGGYAAMRIRTEEHNPSHL